MQINITLPSNKKITLNSMTSFGMDLKGFFNLGWAMKIIWYCDLTYDKLLLFEIIYLYSRFYT